MYDDGIEEIEFPTSICPDTAPHAKHRIAGTWRDECPGVQGPEAQHNATGEYPCTECGHLGNGNVPGCTCVGCDDRCGKELAQWPYGHCTEPAGHRGDHDRRQTSRRGRKSSPAQTKFMRIILKHGGDRVPGDKVFGDNELRDRREIQTVTIRSCKERGWVRRDERPGDRMALWTVTEAGRIAMAV